MTPQKPYRTATPLSLRSPSPELLDPSQGFAQLLQADPAVLSEQDLTV